MKERTVDTVVLDGEDLEGLDHRPAADPTDGAHVMATTDAFGSEADALEADLAGGVASGAVTLGDLGAEEAPKAPAETPKAPAELTPAVAETPPAETTAPVGETPAAATEAPAPEAPEAAEIKPSDAAE